MKRLIHLLLVILFLVGPIWSEEKVDPKILTIDRIFKSREFSSQRFGPARWLNHKSGYTTLEKSETKEGRDIVRYEPANGKRFVEVSAKSLIPEGEEKPLQISDYHWSENGKWLLIFTNTQRVWRTNTRGDYWVLNLKNKQLWKLGGDAEESTLMFAKISPNAQKVAYVMKNDLYVQQLGDTPETRNITRLTKDGSTHIINGTFDWVHEEEFFLRDGFRWSPDSKNIAYWQLDTEGIKDFYLINNTDTLYPELIPVQYPKVGTVNSASKIGVVSISGGQTLWFNLPGDSRDYYLARMDWAGNAEEVVFQRLNRQQNTNWVMLGNIQTGEVKTIIIEKDEAWLEVDNNLKWIDGGKRFTWVSERDGWRHIYVVSRSGENMQLVTPGEFDIDRVVKIDTRGGWVYYTASPDNSGQRYLFRSSLNGKQKLQRLTPANLTGTHSYQISEDSKWAIHYYSSFQDPGAIQLVRLPSHKTQRVLVDHSELKAKLSALESRPVEFMRIDVGEGVALDAYSMKPPDFDPSKKYPVLFYVYGEPWGQTVRDAWSGRGYLWHLMLTQQGYIVMSVDNRGTPSLRGRAFRKCVYGQVGVQASVDQAAAVSALIKRYSYIDADRIGIWGWSGGGSMTLNMMFRFPDLYKTGMSVAPVPDQTLYDTIYQERYMGLLKDNEEGYKKGSPITYANQLKGNLLIVHGTGDDNVHYQGTERLINKLIEYNKQFTMMAYPNRSHGIYEGKNTSRHLYTLLTGYLHRNLPAGPR